MHIFCAFERIRMGIVTLAIATLAAKVVRSGKLDEKDFPLLMHIDGIINNGDEVNIPWLEFEQR